MSKQFLAETMQHLAEVNTFRCARQTICDYHFIAEPFLCQIRFLVIDWNGYSRLKATRIPTDNSRLRSLEVHIDSVHIAALWFHKTPSINTLENTAIAKSLDGLRGLERFRLIDNPTLFKEDKGCGSSREQGMRRAERVEQFEGILQQMVTRSHAEESTEVHAQAVGG